MESHLFAQMKDFENKHWWFIGRRRIIETALQRMSLPPNTNILEVGCGTGGNLELLSRYGEVDAMEYDESAIEIASQSVAHTIKRGWLPDNIPFKNRGYDLIVLFDVLEHIQDDKAALSAIREKLTDNGKLLITVPAFRFLWSKHDDIHHHFRRYIKNDLIELLRMAGYHVGYASYFNSILFPLIALKRIVNHRFFNSESEDLVMPGKVTNYFLYKLFAAERLLVGRLTFPFGVSLIAMAEKIEISNSDAAQ